MLPSDIIVVAMKQMYGAILGRNSFLSTAEVFARSNNSAVLAAWDREFCIFEGESIEQQLPYMGGVQQYFEVLAEIRKDRVEAEAPRIIAEYCSNEYQGGKFPYAVNVHGMYKKYQRSVIDGVKRELAAHEVKARFVHKDMQKNVPNARLLSERIIDKGMAFVLCQSGQNVFLGRILWVQPLDEYTNRDMNKPVRDMKTGMLPPKLAQIMLSLIHPYMHKTDVLWDPFCGSGVLCMEAMREFPHVFGSDISEDMVEKTRKNTIWYKAERGTSYMCDVFQGDATDVQLYSAVVKNTPHLGICTEGYLGENYTFQPPTGVLLGEKEKVWGMVQKVVRAMKLGLPKGTAVCFMMPFYPTLGERGRMMEMSSFLSTLGVVQLPLCLKDVVYKIDRRELKELTKEGTYLYKRDDQFVGREIILFKI